jgi:hypothetical protein
LTFGYTATFFSSAFSSPPATFFGLVCFAAFAGAAALPAFAFLSSALPFPADPALAATCFSTLDG